MPSEQANQTRQPTENLQEGRTVTKNIVLMSDGTGNSAAKVWRTNVWRLFESLDLTNSSQVAIYDDGVGSSSFKLLAALGGAVGWGLKRNVLDLYAFLCRNYGPNARIYAFGFSRGAFTIRVLLGLVNNQGLVPVNSEAQLRRDAKAAYRAYRRERYRSNLNLLVAPLRALRDAAIEVWHRSLGRTTYRQRLDVLKPRVHFVGLWDTVAAYGLPIEEMTRGVSLWIWPLSLPDRHLSDNVDRACHALSLDDARTTFHPVLWSEKGHKPPPPRADGYCYIEDERLTQVWFAGVHANVGGGYPDDSLSRVSLYWMMREAQARGLRLKADPPADPDALRWARSASDKDGRLYDSRHGVAGYYRYGPRKIHDLSHMRFSSTEDDEVTIDVPKIHCSAIERIINGAHAYAPIGFPDRYAVVDPDGKILNLDDPKNAHETPAQATARKDVQERVWNLVWGRRVTYFATLAATLYLVFFPLIHDAQQAGETSSRFYLLAPIIRTVALILPSFTNWWIEAYVASPGWFALGAIAVAALMLFGADLERSITDRMRIIWGTILKQKRVPAGQLPNDFVYRLRTHRIYQWVVWAMKRYILPTLFAALLVYVALAGVSRVLFAIGDSFGLVCRGSDPPPLTAAIVKPFDPSLLCWASGAGLEARRRYRLTLTLDPNVPWRDGSIDTDLGGFSREKMSSAMYWGLPWRRTLSEPWFKPIARIGSTGGDEYPLTSARPVSRDDLKRQLVAEFQTRTKGELFLYVNDAVVGLPGLADTFYVGERGRNFGRAEIKVERID